jgi:hypothetical protein
MGPKNNGVKTPWLFNRRPAMLFIRVKLACDGCPTFRPDANIMRFILQSLCQPNAVTAQCKAPLQTAGNLQSQLQSGPARPVQIAHRSGDLPQSAWSFRPPSEMDADSFSPQVSVSQQAATLIPGVSCRDFLLALKRIRRGYVDCYLIGSKHWQTKPINQTQECS